MASVVEICNNALNQLGASTILSLTEDSKNARLCNARYESIRNAVFRSHTWNCLMARQEIAADTATPVWGWANQFTLPSDCLRVITISDYDYDYKVEGNIQPIGQRKTEASFPEGIVPSNPPVKVGKRYYSRTQDIYKKPEINPVYQKREKKDEEIDTENNAKQSYTKELNIANDYDK